jgi:hypothetical protein
MTTHSLLKQTMRTLRQESRHLAPSWMAQGVKWMSPGLLVKRWMLMSASGVLLVSLGFAIWVKLTPVYYLSQLAKEILELGTRYVPSYISGPIVVGTGLMLVFWGQKRTFGSITAALVPDRDEGLVDMLITHRRLNRGTSKPIAPTLLRWSPWPMTVALLAACAEKSACCPRAIFATAWPP